MLSQNETKNFTIPTKREMIKENQTTHSIFLLDLSGTEIIAFQAIA